MVTLPFPLYMEDPLVPRRTSILIIVTSISIFMVMPVTVTGGVLKIIILSVTFGIRMERKSQVFMTSILTPKRQDKVLQQK